MVRGVHLKKKPGYSDSEGVKPSQTPPAPPKHLTCDRGETWTTTAGRLARSSWWKPRPGSLPLYPRCTFGRTLQIKSPAESAPGTESYTDPCRITPGLTFLFVEITVDVPLHLCVAAVSHPGQMLAGDGRTRFVVEGSDNKMLVLI